MSGTGCGQIPITGNEPTPSAAPIATEPPVSQIPEATPTAAPVNEPARDPNVLYQDDFTDPATSWPEAKFDNYFIGYHEPEYYHVELTSANDKTTVFEPQKSSYGDATAEKLAFTSSLLTVPQPISILTI